MNILFEEDGAFRAGSVLSSTDASFQVELPSGKRAKVKAAHALLRFDAPSAAQLLEAARAEEQTIDLDFLWEAAPQDEFEFGVLARDYYGAGATPVQQAALLMRLHSAPVYFHRKGRGRYRPAPPEILRAALAAVERKRRQEELRQQYVDELAGGRAPATIAAQAIALLVKPDKASIEYKAVEQAANEQRTTPLRLLIATGAIASPYRWHVDSFTAQHFPRGTGFAADLPEPVVAGLADLPLADVTAFSIDDSATSEIDDALSVTAIDGAVMRVGIHIAAPALLLPRGGADGVEADRMDALASQRMSTVYAPGLKYTMLPPAWIAAFSLDEGREVPVLSLYVDVDRDTFAIRSTASRIERVRIAANLRHDRLDTIVTDAAMSSGTLDAPFATELAFLWRFSRALLARREAVRGRPEPLGRPDYSFELDGADEHARVSVKTRLRGAPLDLLVAELMILANSTWGKWLAERGAPAVYRSQSLGRVRMSTSPAPHEGIGVSHYAWSTSPLRRYVDLVNQRQLIAAVRGAPAPYAAGDADLFAIVSGFEAAYGAYAEFQQKMERYWGLRWLRQEGVRSIGATVIRGDVLRLAGLPFITRLPGLPELPRGQQIELAILGGDDVDLTLDARVQRVLTTAEPAAADIDEEVVEEALAAEADAQADANAAPAATPVEGDAAAPNGAHKDAASPGREDAAAPPDDSQ